MAGKAVLRINPALLFCGKCLCGSGEKYGQEEYDFSLRETQTYKLIEDVAQMRSEIGILFLNDFNEKVIRKILKSSDLEFHLLFVAEPHVLSAGSIRWQKENHNQ